MMPNKAVGNNFAEYLQTIVQLDTLQRITSELDKELSDSQRVMDDIKNMFNAVPELDNEAGNASNGLRHEDVMKFLEAEPPQVLPPDMVDNAMEIDLDTVIASMKVYAEDLKKNLVVAEPRPARSNEMESLELEQYASSLDQLGKRLANIKLNKKDEVQQRNMELEAKLSHLCEDVNTFTQMVKTKTMLEESNKNCTPMQENNGLCYDNIVNKLLSGINEVTYLLQNKK